MFNIGVFAIVFNEKKDVLLCHRRDFDLWNLPGGGLNKNESPWEGAIRETKEETGFKISIEKLVGVYHKSQKNELVFSFLGFVTGGKIALNEEADKIKFFPVSNLPKNISAKHKERIRDALKKSKQVILKNQNDPDFIELKKELNRKFD
jgi:ADP-ribose pyrophosphatase YjhB (NUDIX family)